MIKEKLQKLCEKRAPSQQTPTKQRKPFFFSRTASLLTARVLQQELVQSLQKVWTKVAVLSAGAVPKSREDPGLALLVFVQQEESTRILNLYIDIWISAALKLSKYISFYPFTNLPLPEPSLPLGKHSLPLPVYRYEFKHTLRSCWVPYQVLQPKQDRYYSKHCFSLTKNSCNPSVPAIMKHHTEKTLDCAKIKVEF